MCAPDPLRTSALPMISCPIDVPPWSQTADFTRTGCNFNFPGSMSATEGNSSSQCRFILGEGHVWWPMIDGLLYVAVFAVLVLCIIVFGMYGARNERLGRN